MHLQSEDNFLHMGYILYSSLEIIDQTFTNTWAKCLSPSSLHLLICLTFAKRMFKDYIVIFFVLFLMHFVEASKCKGIILLKSCCVELLDERVYLQHVVSVTVISSAHIKGNSILGKMLILWEIHGKNKKQKTNARHAPL